MGLSKFTLKIGTKLALMSGLGIVLVAGMIGSAMYGNSQVATSMAESTWQQQTGTQFTELMVDIRAAQLAVAQAQLAGNEDELKRATDLLERRSKTTLALFDTLIQRAKIPENRARVEKLKTLYADYLKGGQEVIKMRGQILGAAIDSLRRGLLEEQVTELVSGRMTAMTREMIELSDKAADSARDLATKNIEMAESQLASAGYLSVGVGSIVILLLIGSSIFGAVSIARPLANLVPALKQLAEGDFNVTIPGLNRGDEIGMIANASEMVADRVGATILNIKMSASEVTNASAEISTSTTDLSQRTEEQAASLEETSASMEEMTATVRKNAENAKQASELAGSTREVADRGGAVVAKTVEAMARIEESSRKISDIIIVIDEIARQTNLLALNAAVEAARAGDAGRGFAVVASEVRSLAQRSSQAAKDIKDLITNSTDQVKDGVELVNRAGESLREIVESIKKVTTVVSEIANASMEQSTGIEQINKALTQMDEVTQQNSALVEENAATAKTLEQQAKSMDERVALFKVRPTSDISAPAAAAPVERPAPPVAAPRQEAPAPKRAAQPKRAARAANGHGGPVGKMQAGLAVALKNDVDWQEF